jgi:hypothetical protein
MDASRRLPAKVLNDFSWWQPVFDLLDPNVRVPAGKQFYLYATQTIDRRRRCLAERVWRRSLRKKQKLSIHSTRCAGN